MFGWKIGAKAKHYRAAESSGAYDGTAALVEHGILLGTRLATNFGWCCVEALQPGDRVLTFDHGMQTVAHVRRTVLFADAVCIPAHLRPVTVPAGALGNRAPMHLLPEQGVLVESDAADDIYGDPFAILPAVALTGYRGIHRNVTPAQIEVISISFDAPQVIFVEGGALLYCPQPRVDLAEMLDPALQPYEVLSLQAATRLVDHMVYESMPATGPNPYFA